MPHQELVETCVRLIKYKKENKELLTYLLFESGHEASFIADMKDETSALFAEINTNTIYWAKKSIRKILRIITKYCNYSGLATTRIEMLIHFCQQMNALNIDIHQSTAMANLYAAQLKKIDKYILTLHEDLQYDYVERMKELRITNY